MSRRRCVAALGMLLCSLSVAACAQKPSIDESAPPLELPASYDVVGHLVRALCAESFRVGDTVSADLSPSPFSKPVPWPKHFRVLLRREVQSEPNPPSQLLFSSVSADADGYSITGSIGTFLPDIESGRNEVGRPPGECYPKGARVSGHLSRTLRIPRMK